MRVLVVHGSENGGTQGLGLMIAEAFVTAGVAADVGDAANVDDVSPYDAVLVGGGLHNGRWHPDARDFCGRNERELRQLPVWLFSSGPLDDSARSGGLAPVPQVQKVARALDVRGCMTFGGVLRAEDTTPLLSRLSRQKVGDFRDPAHVSEWVASIIGKLHSGAAARGVPGSAGGVDESVGDLDGTSFLDFTE